jgi:hypothetical protein
MRIAFIFSAVAAFAACVACYFAGVRSAAKYSPTRGERVAMITYAVEMYRAAEATNFTKLHSFLDTEILALTHDYETRFGVPTGPDKFSKDFQDAKVIADRLKKELIPTISVEEAFGSRIKDESGK